MSREGRRTAPACVIYNELVSTSKKYMRCVSAVEERWILEARPDLLRDAIQRAESDGKNRDGSPTKEERRAMVAERRRKELAARQVNMK